MNQTDSLKQIFGEDGLKKIRENPIVSGYLNDPEFISMIQDINENPQNILKHQSKFSNPLALMTILPLMIPNDKHEEEKNIKVNNKEKAEKAKQQGNELFSQGKYAAALGKYNEALILDPENIIYHTNKCTALIKLEDYQGAISAAHSAISAGKRNLASEDAMWKAYMKLGTAYKLAGEKDQAIIAFETASGYKQDVLTTEALKQLRGK